MRLSVAIFSVTHLIASALTQFVTSDFEYVGCYEDQGRRKMRGEVRHFPYMTHQMCKNYCKHRSFKYAGLQNGNYCFCGDETPYDSDKKPDGQCSSNCAGENLKKCGGFWRNEIYSTGKEPLEYEYVGCYVDEADRRMKGYFTDINQMTPRSCIDRCRDLSFKYAGLQFSHQCFCGNEEPNTYDRRGENECSANCPGDYTHKCGAAWRSSVYKTLLPWNDSLEFRHSDYQYLGCYLDQGQRKLRGEYRIFPYMTQEVCMSFCKKRKFRYAGLQFRSSCFCGDETPYESDRRSESDCNLNCPGQELTKCGGTWRNAIYSTGEVPPKHEYVGCYLDEWNRRLKGFHIEISFMTPRSCIDLCRDMNFKYAGLQFGQHCFCGNEEPNAWEERYDCNMNCAGDWSSKCGSLWRNSIYKTLADAQMTTITTTTTTTPSSNIDAQMTTITTTTSTTPSSNIDTQPSGCIMPSVTLANGKLVCKNSVIFQDNFDSLSSQTWNHVVKHPRKPDYKYVVFDSDPVNSYISDGKLVIKPTQRPNFVEHGTFCLENCTAPLSSLECGYTAESASDMILPPIQSARLTTSKSFAFRYGRVDIVAKLPSGDWLVPELWLEPKNEVYGPGYYSGRIQISKSLGNKDLSTHGRQIGSERMTSSVRMAMGNDVKAHSIERNVPGGWYQNYHTYTVIWTPDNLVFEIDGQQPVEMLPGSNITLWNVLGFATPIWTSLPKVAPFDQEFYITLGVSAAGGRDFPDGCINNGQLKPWRNGDIKALRNFWEARTSWLPTWNSDTAALYIDSITVTAL